MSFGDLPQACRDIILSFWSPSRDIRNMYIDFQLHTGLVWVLEQRKQMLCLADDHFLGLGIEYFALYDFFEDGYKKAIEANKKYTRWYLLKEIPRVDPFF